MKLFNITPYLRGAARQTHLRYTQLHKDDRTLANFSNKLIKQFEPVAHQKNLKIKLRDLRQTDSLERYILRYKAIVNQIRDLSEADQLLYFRTGLKPNIELNVLNK